MQRTQIFSPHQRKRDNLWGERSQHNLFDVRVRQLPDDQQNVRASMRRRQRREADLYEVWRKSGPPTPTRLLRLFGSDREIFLKGRRCENQGLGIGAFTYYRRVVEGHKDAILDEVLKVSKNVGAPPEAIAALVAAKEEIQFSKAMASIKDAIPQMLLVRGHNPLTLLHTALSVGVHDLTDERCLELAHDIRIVLVELTERLAQALKDEAELTTAVARLLDARK